MLHIYKRLLLPAERKPGERAAVIGKVEVVRQIMQYSLLRRALSQLMRGKAFAVERHRLMIHRVARVSNAFKTHGLLPPSHT